MFKVIHYVFIAGIGGAILTGCTDNGLLFRSFGDYGAEENTATYKLGSPYQIKDTWYTPQENYTYKETGIAGWYQEDQGKLTSNGEKYDEEVMSGMHKTLPLPSVVRVTNLENGNVAIVRINERGPYVNNRLIDVSQKAAQMLEFNMVGTTMVKVEILPEESKLLKKQLLQKNGGVFSEEPENAISSSVQISSLSEVPQPLYQPDAQMQVIYGENDMTNAPQQENSSYSGGIVSITKPPLEAVSGVATPLLTQSDAVAHSAPLAVSEQAPIQNTPEKSQPLIAPISGYYVQAGAFSNSDNAINLKGTLEQFGPVQIQKTQVGEQTLHRVRMGPLETRESAEELLKKLHSGGFSHTQIIYEP